MCEEGLICQETELAWRFAKRARELIDIEEARLNACSRRLPPIVSASQLVEKFNSGLIQTKPESAEAEETNEP